MRGKERRKEAGRPEAGGVKGGGPGERFAVQMLARRDVESVPGSWREPPEPPGSRVPAHASPPHLSHPPIPTAHQDAAGPPGPVCAGPAARLRLAGAPVREHPGCAGPPGTPCAVGAPARPPQTRTARPCARTPLCTHPGQDQGASGGVSARSGGGRAALAGGGMGSFCFLHC